MLIKSEQIISTFNMKYSPYLLKGYIVPELKYDDIPFDPEHPQLRTLTLTVDSKRKADPFIGAKLAGQEIYVNLLNYLKNENGVHIETLLAVIGSLGGRECVDGIMKTLNSLINENSPNRQQLINIVATTLNIMIVDTKNGEQYILGDRIGNIFSSFYETAASEQGIAVNHLKSLASEVASQLGSNNYWLTPFDDCVKHSPKELADLFYNKFEVTFNTYCRFPYERMFAFAIAAQKAIKEVQVQSVISKTKALSILSEFGWRTSHYLEQ